MGRHRPWGMGTHLDPGPGLLGRAELAEATDERVALDLLEEDRSDGRLRRRATGIGTPVRREERDPAGRDALEGQEDGLPAAMDSGVDHDHVRAGLLGGPGGRPGRRGHADDEPVAGEVRPERLPRARVVADEQQRTSRGSWGMGRRPIHGPEGARGPVPVIGTADPFVQSVRPAGHGLAGGPSAEMRATAGGGPQFRDLRPIPRAIPGRHDAGRGGCRRGRPVPTPNPSSHGGGGSSFSGGDARRPPDVSLAGWSGGRPYSQWVVRAWAISSSRKSGWAMPMSSRARSRTDLPQSWATPHSVTIVRA